jgi:hypothetical protein
MGPDKMRYWQRWSQCLINALTGLVRLSDLSGTDTWVPSRRRGGAGMGCVN